MIRTFADKRTAAVFADIPPKGLPSGLQRRVREELVAINQARADDDLRTPLVGRPAAGTEADDSAHFSIPLDEQWRLRFVWRDGEAYEVELADLKGSDPRH
jgi:proteic killer suppression protein